MVTNSTICFSPLNTNENSDNNSRDNNKNDNKVNNNGDDDENDENNQSPDVSAFRRILEYLLIISQKIEKKDKIMTSFSIIWKIIRIAKFLLAIC
ncbi:hypothetical protein RhiirC2_767531 [Rhizophagus irregularis]|uniref:Uncharacterized protein n=1 Tax=Rhizophagus irregularis TaxID=588596 RepID=A0A2N1MU68_9GLOM|nr:hypothetical protein RhiirC2_786519 [Rhizophagus irregularis]PKK80889.1 hypothetical protein RhiirC2_767531 [Rhizophagus irregularis]